MPRLFALAGALQPVWLLAGAAVVGTLRAGYDATHAISELGEQGSQHAVVWNLAGFGVAALLCGLFALAIRDAVGGGWLFRVLALQAGFLGASGVFGCDPGCPPLMTSWQGWAHTVVGLAYFALTWIAPLAAWRTLRSRHEWRSLARVSLAAGVILIGLFFTGPLLFGPALVGVWQRITIATAGVWTTTVALRLWQLTSPVAAARAGPNNATHGLQGR